MYPQHLYLSRASDTNYFLKGVFVAIYLHYVEKMANKNISF